MGSLTKDVLFGYNDQIDDIVKGKSPSTWLIFMLQRWLKSWPEGHRNLQHQRSGDPWLLLGTEEVNSLLKSSWQDFKSMYLIRNDIAQASRWPSGEAGKGDFNKPWSPTGKARGTSMFFGGIRRSIPSYAQGFGGLSSSHSSTAIGRDLLRRRINLLYFLLPGWVTFSRGEEEW